MSNTITLKKSGVSGNAPASGDLSLGEIALNYADGHLYYKSGASATPAKINAGDADTVDGFHLNQDVRSTASPTFAGLNIGEYIRHDQDSNTYLRFTADTLRLAAGGVEMIKLSEGTDDAIIFNEAGGDVDFRVEASGEANALFVGGSNGNVGIGTASPSYRLDVSGDNAAGVIAVRNAANGRDTLRSENTSGTRTFNIGNDGNGHGILLVRNNVGTTSNYITGNGNSYFNAGNVGIGTTSPSEKLFVAGSIGLNTGQNIKWGSGATKITGIDGSYISFTPNNSEKVRFLANGNVGIGTTSPSYKLDVDGTTSTDRLIVNQAANGTNDLLIKSAGGTYTHSLGADTSGYTFKISTISSTTLDMGAGSSKFYLNMGGSNSWQIGSDFIAPASAGAGSVGHINAGHGGYFGFYTIGSTTSMPVFYLNDRTANDTYGFKLITKNGGTVNNTIVADNDGNVGIGTTSPSSKLHVNDTSVPSSGDLITSKIYSSGNVAANSNTRTGLDVETIRGGWFNSDSTSGNFKISSNNRIGDSDLIGVKSLATVDVNNIYSGVAAAGSLTAFYGKVSTTHTTGSGPVATAYGLRIDAPEVATDSEIGTYYGAYIDGASVSGTLTNKYALVTEAAAGNVGIGTTSPSERLHIHNSTGNGATIRLSDPDSTSTANATGYVEVYHGENTSRAGYFGLITNSEMALATTTSAGNIKLYTGNNTAALTIDSSQRVGIGTTSPDAPLSVKVGSSTTEAKVFELLANGGRALSILQPDNAQSADPWTFATNNSYTFRVDAIDALNIDYAGNVGIGTTSPDSRLHVVGSTDSDAASLGSEIVASQTASGTNWSGSSIATGYTHTAGSTDVLLSTLNATTNKLYRVEIETTNVTAGRLDKVSFGGIETTVYITNNTTLVLSVKATSTGPLTFECQSAFVGTVTVSSVKEIVASDSLSVLTNSGGSGRLETRVFSTTDFFLGDSGGENRVSSGNNIGIGNSALQRIATAGINLAIGNRSLSNLTNGQYNVAIGHDILGNYQKNGNVYNIGIGNNVMDGSSMTGQNNIMMGFWAGANMTSASHSLGIGYSVFGNLTSGSHNIALGENSLGSLTTGGANVAIGNLALYSLTTSSSNTAIGYTAGRYAVGNVANQTASQSVYIGHQTKAAANAQSNQIVIGYNADGIGSNTVTLGNDSIVTTALKGNVGIGTTSPSSLLHLEAATSPALQIKDTTNNVTFKAYAQDSNSHLANTSNHDLFIDTNNTSRIAVKADGKVGIGTTSPQAKLQVSTANHNTIALAIGNDSYTGGHPRHELLMLNDGSLQWYLPDNGSTPSKFQFYSRDTATYPFTIDSNTANVGIGTTTPATPLHVTGEVRVDATEGVAARKIRSNYFSSSQNLDLVCGASASLILGDGTARLTLASDDSATFAGDVVVSGGLTVNGTTSTINSTTLQVDDKNIELGTVATPTDTTADGGGITLKGATDKTINWVNSTDAWTFSNKISTSEITTASGTLTLNPAGTYVYLGSGKKLYGANIGFGYQTNAVSAIKFLLGPSIDNPDMRIERVSSNLLIQNEVDDGDILFKGSDGGSTITALTLDMSDAGKATFNSSIAATDGTLTGDLTVSGEVEFSALNSASASPFVVSDGGTLGTRTAAQVLTDISALPLAGGTITGNVKFNDNAELRLGSGADLKLYHNGTTNNSNIENNVGGLYITNYADDSDIVFRSDDGSGSVTDYLRLDGGQVKTFFSKTTIHTDGVEAQFGSGADLKIYHTGSDSYIDDIGTGSLYIRGANDVNIRSYNGGAGEQMIKAIANGAVELYHDNVKKFETTASGIQVTGTNSWDIYSDNTAATFDLNSTTRGFLFKNGNGDLVTIDNNGRVGIGVTPSSAKLEVNGHFAATTKSFIIDNPKTGGKLQYGVVESNEHGVYVRGKTDQDEIELPEEWEWLVDEDSVTVDLTSIGQMQHLFIIEQTNKKVKVGGMATNGQYNYVIYGTRKDVDPLEINI